MSKAGNAVRKSMRSKLESSTTNYLTRVGDKGAYLQKVPSRSLGGRESHTVDNQESNPSNMSAFITNFLMEKSETLVVGGANPRHTPLLRENGEVVGTGKTQGAVSPRSIAILHRMDTGEENSLYPTRSKLMNNVEGRGFMKNGMVAASGKVRAYLAGGFLTVMRQAQATHIPKKVELRLA